MSGWRLLPGANLVAAPWRNGLGVSRDLHTMRSPDGGLLWQASLADLERDAPFSDYTGIDRVFTLLTGAVSLSIDGAPFQPCTPLAPVAFRGEAATLSRVTQPGRALNLFATRAACRVSVQAQTLQPGQAAGLNGAALAYLVSGCLHVGGQALHPGDSLLPGADRPDASATVPSTLLLARITLA